MASTTHESTSTFHQVTDTVKSTLAELGERVQATIGEVEKMQERGLEQARSLVDTAARATQEQIAFAEQLGSEWRKLVLAATRSTAELFTRNA